MKLATKIATAIEGKLTKQKAQVKLIELKEFKYIEIAFVPVGGTRMQEVASGYSWQFFASENRTLQEKATVVYSDFKALLGLDRA